MDNISTIFLVISLFIVMLGMGLSLTLDDFKNTFNNIKPVFIGLFGQLILLPIIGYSIVNLLHLPSAIALGIMVIAACPGGPTSNLISHLAKGDLALSISLTAISSIITIFTIPFIINLSSEQLFQTSQVVKIDPIKTILQLFVITIIPTSIGMFINYKNKSFAQKMEKMVKTLSAVVLGIVILGILIKERVHIIEYFAIAGAAALLLNILSMGISYLLALLILNNNKQATTISIESGIQNGTLGILIATTLLNNTEIAIPAAVYSLIMFGSGALFILLNRNK